jgi:methyl-galactoside transport system substrate-binding protein
MRRKVLIGVILVILLMGVAGYFTKGLLTPKIGLCLNGADSALYNELTLAGYTVLSRNCENNQETQNRQVEELLQEKVDVLVVQSVDADAASQILQIAVETPVIFIGTEPTELGNAYYVGCDASQQGVVQAQMLQSFFGKADINGDRLVDYMVISGPENVPQSQVYLQSVATAMAEKSAIRLEEAYCDPDADTAKKLCRQAFSKYGRDLELILCNSESVALGAANAVRDSGRVPGRDVIIFAVGKETQLKEMVRTGVLTAAAVEDTNAVLGRIVRLIEELTKNKTVEQKQYISYKIWTIDNVNS